jgi:DNA-binding NarL/FixJ family response regulator
LLVDDHPAIRLGLRAGLEAFDGFVVAGEAGDGDTAIKLARAMQPDVAVVDVSMPGLDGFETAASIRAVSPPTRIALISGMFDAPRLNRGLAIGTRAFVLKTEHPREFAEFVREIHRGGCCCSKTLLDLLVPGPDGFRLAPPEGPRLDSLTMREWKLFVRLARGESLKQAARTTGLSYKSADHLKQSLMKKLDVHDRVDLVRLAIREGLIS